jgi:phenylalanyl-tRNA synthetase alpha subunit
MADDKIYTILLDIQKQLGENTKQTNAVNGKLDVFITQQTATNSKLNGLYQAHTHILEALPEERRKEIFGEVNKLKHYIEDEIKPLKDDLQERQDSKKKYKDGIFGVKMSILEKITWVSIGFIFFNLNHVIAIIRHLITKQ